MNLIAWQWIKKHCVLVLSMIVFLVAFGRLLPFAYALEQHGDEKIYAYRGGYYMGRLVSLDFSGPGANTYADPGFTPTSFFSLDTPFGSNFYYAIVFFLTGVEAPAVPFIYLEGINNGDNTMIPENSLPVLRASAILAAASGLALISYRFGVKGAAACMLFLFIPHIRDDLSRAWSEGPLLLGFGLCAASYRTRWFPLTAAMTGAFKLNGMIVWPFLLIPSAAGKPAAGKSLRTVLLNIWQTLLLWSFFTPASWTAGGPAYLGLLWKFRISVFADQSQNIPTMFGFFIPTRYIWPLELAALLILAHLPQVLAWVRTDRSYARSSKWAAGSAPGPGSPVP